MPDIEINEHAGLAQPQPKEPLGKRKGKTAAAKVAAAAAAVKVVEKKEAVPQAAAKAVVVGPDGGVVEVSEDKLIMVITLTLVGGLLLGYALGGYMAAPAAAA